MKLYRILFVAALALVGLTARAQDNAQVKFHPHVFLQVQDGASYTVGEADFDKLITNVGSIGVGYQFTPAWALRLSASGNPFGAAGKGGFSDNSTYSWKYVTPALDVKFNLVDAIKGYNPKRVFSFNILAGVGANIAWDNDEACAMSKRYAMPELWSGTKVRPVGRAGVGFDFRVHRRLAITTEFLGNVLSEKYNSKRKASEKNADWYFTGMVGLRIGLGKVDVTEEPVEEPVPYVAPEPVPEPKPTPKPKPEPVVHSTKTEIFYAIRQTETPASEQSKLDDLINFMKRYPETQVVIEGYADVGTGNPKVNMRYSEGRANNVAKALVAAGINEARITVKALGDTVQPYAENDKNRVTIAFAK